MHTDLLQTNGQQRLSRMTIWQVKDHGMSVWLGDDIVISEPDQLPMFQVTKVKQSTPVVTRRSLRKS
ncbi:hypothetical protein TNCV_4398981 [Trichonephila clavipes]|nr:hypothetical protein TNCV_4398981 [Trichonephila clavipes]